MHGSPSRLIAIAALVVGAAIAITGCSAPGAVSSAPGATTGPAAGDGRIAVSYQGGIRVLDATTLRSVAEFDTEDFTRLNAAGDDRHVMVTTSKGFQVLDTAAGKGREPRLTDLVFPAAKPGHVVHHGGRTILYADGTSDTTVFETAALSTADTDLPETRVTRGVAAHHGVSVVLKDGTFLTTVGNAEGRTGITVTDPSGRVIAGSDQCPGVHGEGTAKDEAVVFGCENGALLYKDGAITKLDAPTQPYGRMGNAYVSETSPLVVGDYKADQDAEGYLLDAVTVIDTGAKTLEVVDLPAGARYTFRDVARGPGDLAYILATDGAVHVFDPSSRTFTGSFPVIAAWEGPTEWQDPHPLIAISGTTAYVTEPAAKRVHSVDLNTGKVTATGELGAAPVELAIAAG